MRIDVLLGEAPVAPADVADRVVVVLDVLRAATTVATALANGARAVVPFETVDEVVSRARVFARGEVLLAGERRMQRINGFDLGNSPREFTAEAIGGRTVLYSTTNGTVALVASIGARACFFAGFVNAQATVHAASVVASAEQRDLTIVCAGHEKRLAFEDVVCAGRLVRLLHGALPGLVRGDGARVAELAERPYMGGVSSLAHDATHARSLDAAGFGADVTACLSLDTFDVATAYIDRQLVRRV
ncbi:MAG: 2-phosphosulfolactate phosphatase [Gemmatimonadaceae bacterium]|nr:2-phosphosulfolactate phosphatase [Gemmatimonadaceae bacterium]